MQTDTTPQILDFNSFRQQREQVQSQPQQTQIPEGFTPTLMWYPVWVLVPNQPPTPGNSA